MRSTGKFGIKSDPMEAVNAVGPDIPVDEAFPKRGEADTKFEAVDVPEPGAG